MVYRRRRLYVKALNSIETLDRGIRNKCYRKKKKITSSLLYYYTIIYIIIL